MQAQAFVLKKVNKRYSDFALQDINLTLPAGEIMGLVGVNGAGKSTTIRLLMGLIGPDSGEVQVLGYNMPDQQVAAKQHIGFASDDMRLYRNRDLNWHMALIKSLVPHWDQQYAEFIAGKFDLRLSQPLKGFSHGQRVKASLLLLLARRPRLLVLDEPTTGLDPVARTEILEELAEVLRDENRSVLFSSHNTHDVEQLSDTLTFLHNGRILSSEPTDSFLDKWRNIRCRGRADDLQLPGALIKQSGSLINIRTEDYHDELPQKLSASGLEILDVSRMSLEEIFVTTVRRETSI